MARGNPEFCRVETSFIKSLRFRSLNATARAVYVDLWAEAVVQRREVIRLEGGVTLYSRCVNVRSSDLKRALFALSDNTHQLIEIIDDEHIKVCGVKSKHVKLEWNNKDDAAPYGADTGKTTDPYGSESRVEKSREEYTPLPPDGGRVGLAPNLLGLAQEDVDPKAFAWKTAITLYDQMAEQAHLPRIDLKGLHGDLKTAFWEHWQKDGFQTNYVQLLHKIYNSRQLRGLVEGGSGWKMPFSFLFQRKAGILRYAAILAGDYDEPQVEEPIADLTSAQSREKLDAFIASQRV